MRPGSTCVLFRKVDEMLVHASLLEVLVFAVPAPNIF